MNWKEFLKPTMFTIIVFIILMIVTSVIFSGFPFNFYTHTNELGTSDAQSLLLVPWASSFNYLNLVYNIVIWYLISCLIAFVYRRFKK